jgi:hypothetical protein
MRLLATCAVAATLAAVATACARTPSEPNSSLPVGRWSTANGACLSVADDQCDLVAGCGHGRFPSPALSRDGTFTAIGTYRVEVGPISLDPPPPATFSGVLSNGTLTLTVMPSDARVSPGTLIFRLTNNSGRCAVPCL